MTIPPTPPPDIDVEAWHESIERIAAWSPARLGRTHFGESADASAELGELGRRLDEWAERVRGQELDEFVAGVRDEVERGAGASLVAQYTQAAPPDQLYMGLERYWRKRAESIPPARGATVS
jgi:hypothetical protein